MSGKHLITAIKNQAFFMTVAIKTVFLLTRHRLCCCHIIENSIKNIGTLRSSERFTKIFNRVLMQCDTEDEFKQIWGRYE